MTLTSLLNLTVHRANFKSRSFTVLITSSLEGEFEKFRRKKKREVSRNLRISKEKEEGSVTEFENFNHKKGLVGVGERTGDRIFKNL